MNASLLRFCGQFKSQFYTAIILLGIPALAAYAKPCIVLPEPSYNFGAIGQTATIQHRFEIQNSGTQPLQIGRIRACCGATARISAMEIAPNTNAYLDVTLSLQGRQGSQTKNIFIASNDPATPYARLQITGSVVTTLTIEPRWINFTQAGGSTPQQEIITLASPADKPFNISDIRIDSPGFEYSHKKAAGTTQQIIVRTKPPLQPGSTRAVLSIQTDVPGFDTTRIPLHAAVASAITVVPSEILLNQNEVGTSRFLAIRCKQGKPFQILETTAMDGGVTIEASPIPDGYRLDISNLVACADGDPQNIVITTDREDARLITVPVRVVAAAPRK